MEKYELFLKKELKPENIVVKESLYSSLSGDYFRIQYKTTTEFFILRKIKILEKDEPEIQRELLFLEKMFSSLPKLKIFAEYYGYYKEYVGNSLIFNFIFII